MSGKIIGQDDSAPAELGIGDAAPLRVAIKPGDAPFFIQWFGVIPRAVPRQA
jgi:hypothetical protein